MTGKKKTARIIIMNHHQSRHTQTANRKQRDSRMEPRLRRCEKVNVLSGSRCLVAPLNVTNCRSERWWNGGWGGRQWGSDSGLHAHYQPAPKVAPLQHCEYISQLQVEKRETGVLRQARSFETLTCQKFSAEKFSVRQGNLK